MGGGGVRWPDPDGVCTPGYPLPGMGYPHLDLDGGYPGIHPPSGPGWGTPHLDLDLGWGTPPPHLHLNLGWSTPIRTTEGVLVTRRMVCLLRSRRRTFLLQISIWSLHYRLYHVDMDLASEEGIEPNMTAVEVCDCPPGYDGLSCEVRETKLQWYKTSPCPCPCPLKSLFSMVSIVMVPLISRIGLEPSYQCVNKPQSRVLKNSAWKYRWYWTILSTIYRRVHKDFEE